ncbi:hypothetical protein, partial [Craurococcus roseus]
KDEISRLESRLVPDIIA